LLQRALSENGSQLTCRDVRLESVIKSCTDVTQTSDFGSY
jgi:hypothetical protein